MKIITQKVLSLLLSLAMLFGMVQSTGLTAFAAADGYEQDSNRTVLYVDSGDISIGNGTVSGYNVDGNQVTTADTEGYVITQHDSTAATTHTVTVTSGIQNISLRGVNIDLHLKNNTCALLISAGAAVNLTLENNNILKSGNHYAGLNVTSSKIDGVSNASLTITAQSTGLLDVTGGNNGAGIGGEDGGGGIGSTDKSMSGTIIIDGGTITANGGSYGAGIGGGHRSAGGSITINGGAIIANGGFCGAGIGGGSDGMGGIIMFNGGEAKVNGGDYGAGIGGGNSGRGGKIIISGGMITANGGIWASGIGGEQDKDDIITIKGGMITTTGGVAGAGIGGGGTDGIITISGGTVIAYGGERGAGIGGCSFGAGSSVTITGSNTQVAAKGDYGGMDIGAGNSGDAGKTLTVGESNVAGGPMVKLLSAGTNTAYTFKNCTITGAGAKDKNSNDIKGTYDKNGHILLNISLTAVQSQKSIGKPVTLTAAITKYGFTNLVSPTGDIAFLCDGSFIGKSQINSGKATYAWVPSDLQTYKLTAAYDRSGDSDSFAFSTSAEVNYSAGKETPTVKTVPTASNITSGSALSSSTLSGGEAVNEGGTAMSGIFTWKTPSAIVTASGSYEAIFTPNDSANYNTVPMMVSVIITANQESHHSSSTETKPATPSIPTFITEGCTNTSVYLSGVTFPTGITVVNLNVTKKDPSIKSDQQASNFSRALLATPKAGVIGIPVIYNMELLDQNGSVTSGTGKIKILLPVPSGLRGTPHVFRFEESTGTFTDMGAKVENGMLVFESDRLGYFAAAGVGDSITLDTTSYTMPVNDNYEIGFRITGTQGTSVKVHSTNDRIAKVVQLKNGNYQVNGTGTGTAYIMFDVYDPKNKLLTHASVMVTVQNGVKPNGNSARQIGIY